MKTRINILCAVSFMIMIGLSSCNEQKKLNLEDIPSSIWAYFSPDGNSILYGTMYDNGVESLGMSDAHIYNIKTRSDNQICSDYWIIKAVVSPNGKRLAVFPNFGTEVNVYDLDNYENEIFHKDINIMLTGGNNIFSPNGDRMVMYVNDTARILNLDAETEICKLDGSDFDLDSDDVRVMTINPSFSSDGKQIVSSLLDKIVFWDSETGAMIRHFDFDKMMVCPTFSADGKHIICTSVDMQGEELSNQDLVIMDATTGNIINSVSLPNAGLCFASYSPQGKWIAVSSFGSSVVYDVASCKPVEAIETAELFMVNTISFSPDDNQLIYVSPEGTVKVLNLK